MVSAGESMRQRALLALLKFAAAGGRQSGQEETISAQNGRVPLIAKRSPSAVDISPMTSAPRGRLVYYRWWLPDPSRPPAGVAERRSVNEHNGGMRALRKFSGPPTRFTSPRKNLCDGVPVCAPNRLGVVE
jgi:hypothetical protein